MTTTCNSRRIADSYVVFLVVAGAMLTVQRQMGISLAWSNSGVSSQREKRLLLPHRNLFHNPREYFSNTATTASSSQSLNFAPPPPRDLKEAVRACRASVQTALQNRISRMIIDFPVGAQFGVEKPPPNKRKSSSNRMKDDTHNHYYVCRSDRELARLFVEMFQPVDGKNIGVIFPTADSAETARKIWSDDASAVCRVLSLSSTSTARIDKAKKKKKQQQRGFAAKLAAEMSNDASSTGSEDGESSGPFSLPSGTEVALFVAPGPKELVTIERICSQVGIGTLVVLLNARLHEASLSSSFSSSSSLASTTSEQFFTKCDFQSIFLLTAAPVLPQESATTPMTTKNCILYHAYPSSSYVLGRKPKLGPPRTLASWSHCPTPEECREAMINAQGRSNTNSSSTGMDVAIEVGVGVLESTVETIASWFR